MERLYITENNGKNWDNRIITLVDDKRAMFREKEYVYTISECVFNENQTVILLSGVSDGRDRLHLKVRKYNNL